MSQSIISVLIVLNFYQLVFIFINIFTCSWVQPQVRVDIDNFNYIVKKSLKYKGKKKQNIPNVNII